MMYVVDPTGYNWLTQTFNWMLDEATKTAGFSQTQKDQAQLKGFRDGLVRGVATTLTTVGTEQRIARIKALVGEHRENVGMLDIFAVEKWVEKELKSYLAGELADRGPEWEEYLSETFAEFVWPDRLVNEYSEARKQRVLDGTIEPTAEDAGWLEEHMKGIQPQIDKLQGLLAQASGGKKI